MHYLNLFTWEKEYNDVCIIKFLFNPCQTTSNLKPILTSQFFISGISKSIPTQNFKPNEPEISSLPTALHDVNTTPYLSIIELIVEFV